MLRRSRVVVVAGLLSFAASDCSQPRGLAAFRTTAWRPASSPSGLGPSPLAIRLIRVLGSESGPLAFGQVGRGAISQRGIVAITDVQSCEVVFLDGATGGFISRYGRCGNGPGELRAVTSMQYVGDTLVVLDARARQVVS